MYKTVKWYGKEVMVKVQENGMKSIAKACHDVETDCKESMKPGSGRTYIRYGKVHKASAPGEPPAVDYGRLRASISSNWSQSGMEFGKVGSKAKTDDGISRPDKPWTGVVGTNVEYAEDLELGKESRNLKPRPYLRPALERQRNNIKKYFDKLV